MSSVVETAKTIAQLQAQLEKLNEKFDKLALMVEKSIKQQDEVSTEMNVRLAMLTGSTASSSQSTVPVTAAAVPPAKKKAPAEPGVKTPCHTAPAYIKAMMLADLTTPETGYPFLTKLNTEFKFASGVGIYDHVISTDGAAFEQQKTAEKKATLLSQLVWKILTEDQKKKMGELRIEYNKSIGGSRDELQVEQETAIEASNSATASASGSAASGMLPVPDL